MQVSRQQLVDWVLANGGAYGVTFAQIERVGVDFVLWSISQQANASQSLMAANGSRFVGEPEADPDEAMRDYFAESFDRDFDDAFRGRAMRTPPWFTADWLRSQEATDPAPFPRTSPRS